MADDAERPALLSKQTMVPLGGAFALGLALIYPVIQLNTHLVHIDHGIEANSEGINDLREDMLVEFDRFSSSVGDRWTKTEMERWVELLEVTNPGLNVPDLPTQGGR